MNNVASRPKFAALALATLLVSACATPIRSTIDSASEVNISDFETYAWISDEPYISEDATRSGLVNPLNHQRIRAGIDVALLQKGYVQVPASQADLILGVTLGARDRIRVQQYYNDFGYRYYGFNRFNRFGGFRRFGSAYGPYSTTTQVHTFTEGSVAVDVFDNKSRQAIWHGQATKSLTGDAMGQKLIAEAVDALIGPIPERQAVAVNILEASEASNVPM